MVEQQEGMTPVQLPSGGAFTVHQSEVGWFNERRKRYLSDNDFQNITDLQDLDRLLVAELLCHRWGTWISIQNDYWGDAVDETTLQKALKDHSGEIRMLKKNMGLDRESREKARGEDSVDNYLALLKQRAKNFGYMRERQLDKALELFNELKARTTFYNNCDETERVEERITLEALVKWIVEDAIPEYDKIDEHFRANDQKYWIREV